MDAFGLVGFSILVLDIEFNQDILDCIYRLVSFYYLPIAYCVRRILHKSSITINSTITLGFYLLQIVIIELKVHMYFTVMSLSTSTFILNCV